MKKGQTQCRKLPREWGPGKRKTEVSLLPAKSAERLLRTHDLVSQFSQNASLLANIKTTYP
jgi:hypothetical protein